MIRLLSGDCRVTLPTLTEKSVQAAITSPPYWGLRSYISDGDPLKPFEIGLEPTPELWIEHLVEVFGQVRRVLRDDGVCWLNLGDAYSGSGKGPTGYNGVQNAERRQGFAGGPDLRAKRSERPREGIAAKNLMMLPARVAIALQQDGWYLRSMIPWLKRNSMPESVTDRPASAVEYVFLLSKSRTYFWDADAVRVGLQASTLERGYSASYMAGPSAKMAAAPEEYRGKADWRTATNSYVPSGRNRRNSDWFFESWQGLLAEEDGPLALIVNPAPFKGSHFATFPPKLVEPMIKASTRPGDTVLDPFFGAGTVGLVADRLGRNAIGCELKPSYVDMGASRLNGEAPMFTTVDVA